MYDEQIICDHCDFSGSSESFEVDDAATDALENSMGGAVGHVCICPDCGGQVVVL